MSSTIKTNKFIIVVKHSQMLYCNRCRRIIQENSDRWILPTGRSEHEVVCFDCLNEPFCQTENCTNPKSSGWCLSCGKRSGHCKEHTRLYKLRVRTAVCNCLTDTRKKRQECEKLHYRYDARDVCQSCWDARCMRSIRCGIPKSECSKCSEELDSCWRHAQHIITEQDEYERPVCQNCYVKYQCANCGLPRDGTSCKLCDKMFCYECRSSKLTRVHDPAPTSTLPDGTVIVKMVKKCHFECTNSSNCIKPDRRQNNK